MISNIDLRQSSIKNSNHRSVSLHGHVNILIIDIRAFQKL